MIVITIRITTQIAGITTIPTHSTEVILRVIPIGIHIITLLVITIDVNLVIMGEIMVKTVI